MPNKKIKPENQLTEEQKEVLINCGTEPPFSGKYVDYKGNGMFNCARCGHQLFSGSNKFKSGSGSNKFKSGSGWPSFDRVVAEGAVELKPDESWGMRRTEVVCKNCGGHLGHVFDYSPTATGKYYCINSAALELDEKNG